MSILQSYAAARQRPLRTAGFAVFAIMLAVTAVFISRQDTSAFLSPNTFQLSDGDALTSGTGEDWEDVFNGDDTADKSLFIEDFYPYATNQTSASDDNQPATGSTKDTLDIDGWNCKEAGLSPPKNDMANAFVASYTVTAPADNHSGSPHPHQVIYFGLDRVNSDNGNANVGFWFLKDNHDCDGNAGTATWTGGKHALGDTLVTSSFTGGGRVSTINIYVWCSNPAAPNLKCGDSTHLPTDPAFPSLDGPLQLVATGADCRDEASNSLIVPQTLTCATVNRTIDTDAPPWPYDGAGNTPDTYERGAFFEGGIDATGLGLDLICAGTFVADTRSSQAPTAQLHDFAIGQVDLCTVSVSTQASTNSTSVVPGTSVTDTATVTQSPASAPVPTGTVKFFLCQPLEVTTGAGCPSGGTQIGSPAAGETLNASGGATSDATTNTTAIGKYCWRAEYSGSAFYAASSHTNNGSECFIVFNPTTVISIADRIIGLPTDATGTVTYGVFTDINCTTAVTTGTPSNGNITPSSNSVGANGVAPLSNLYTPSAPGTFYLKATFTGTGIYAGVNFASCNESAVLTF